MKLGIISDVHSNLPAFRACVEYMEKENVDEYLLLGDYVSDTPYTKETMEYLYEVLKKHTCHILRGNREEYLLDYRKSENKNWKYNSCSGNLLYTYERLSDKDLDFFESLPITFRLFYDGLPSITCCHGSPDKAKELLPAQSENAAKWMARIDTDYFIGAHSHRKCIETYGDKTYLNVGSCGLTIHNAGCAECAILTGEYGKDGEHGFWHIELLNVPYDARQVIRDIFDMGLYDAAPWFSNANIHTLATGIDHTSRYVGHAIGLAKEATGEGNWPDIEEEYFEIAAGKDGIPVYTRDGEYLMIRRAKEEDAKALLSIYAPYVTDTAVTYECDVPSVEEFAQRIREKGAKYPYLVAETEDEIVGYAYASVFRTRKAYNWDVELSVYIRKDQRGKGIGKKLVSVLEDALYQQGVLNIIAVMVSTDREDDLYLTDASVRFHTAIGYTVEGHLRNSGCKFGRFYDTIYAVKHLDLPDGEPPEVLPYFWKG